MTDTTKKTKTLDDGELEKAQGGGQAHPDLGATSSNDISRESDHGADLGQIGGLHTDDEE